MSGELLRAENLTRRFGGLVAVGEVGFAVQEGEILSVIGPNGAGKSTLFKLLCGFLRPNTGRVVFRGRDLTGMRPHQVARLGLVRTFQETTIFRDMTALEGVVAAHHIRCRAGVAGIFLNTSRAREDERKFERSALDILKRLGLGGMRNEQAKNLPHGHLRALGIAAALATGPEALLLDEPLAGMNPEETDRMVEMIDGVRKGGVTILLVEHDMRAVMRISDRIVALNFGRKIAEGRPEEIRGNPDVIEAYLGKEDDEVGH